MPKSALTVLPSGRDCYANDRYFSSGFNPPAITHVDRLERFFALLQQNANRGYTIVGRFEELKRALEVMYSNHRFGWILAFGGYHVRDRVRLERRPIPVIDSALWLDWAVEPLTVADTLPGDRARADLWQDALIIGLLGMRGMRLRTLAGIRIGIHLLEHDTGFRLDVSVRWSPCG